MEFRSILVHLDGGSHAAARIAYAGALALQFDAQLQGLAPTGWAVIPPDGISIAGLEAYQQSAMRTLMDQAESCVTRFKEQTAAMGVGKVCAKVEVGYDGEAMTAAARYCDVTVVTRIDAHPQKPPQSPHMPEDVLMGSGRPVLVLPCLGSHAPPPPSRVLLAWNGSREAARAAHDALPLLRKAGRVDVVTFSASEEGHRQPTGPANADVGIWLAEHGVHAEVTRVPTRLNAGEAILESAGVMRADLIVAGGYGHSRLGEAVFGGATRVLMRSSPVPVLLSH